MTNKQNKILLISVFILLTGCENNEAPAKHIEKIINQCNKNDGLKSVIVNYGNMFVTTIKCNDGAEFIIDDTK
jgi:hypothetical protein